MGPDDCKSLLVFNFDGTSKWVSFTENILLI
jgi:hypothetical protein